MLNAVTCVWNEEDIIESSVRHAFAQGCEHVFIVDNGSTDETVRRAQNAGAELAISFKTKFFDERQKIAHLNAVVKYYNSISSEDATWWMYFDADEFPNIKSGVSIHSFLRQLDVNIRGLHGYFLNHVPTHHPYLVRGYHPIDFMPLCERSSTAKIPVLRYDKNTEHLFSAGGAHEFDSNGEPVFVINDIIDIHHFPYRNPFHTISRLKLLLDKTDSGESRIDWMDKRSNLIYKKTQSHYHERYNNARSIYANNYCSHLKHFNISYDFRSIPRWYPEFYEVGDVFTSEFDRLMFLASYNFFMGNYDTAICRFNDTLEFCDSEELSSWIMIKMAECFAVDDILSARALLKKVMQFNNTELSSYIKSHLQYIIDGTENKASGLRIRKSEATARVEIYRGKFKIDPSKLRCDVDKIMKKIAFRHSKNKL